MITMFFLYLVPRKFLIVTLRCSEIVGWRRERLQEIHHKDHQECSNSSKRTEKIERSEF